MQNEISKQRRNRQNKAYRKMIKQLKVEVAQMYQRKVQKDAWYIDYKNIVEECI